MKEHQIVYEKGTHWAARLPCGQFEVYRNEITHSVRCAIIGFSGDVGLQKAKREVDRREDGA